MTFAEQAAESLFPSDRGHQDAAFKILNCTAPVCDVESSGDDADDFVEEAPGEVTDLRTEFVDGQLALAATRSGQATRCSADELLDLRRKIVRSRRT